MARRRRNGVCAIVEEGDAVAPNPALAHPLLTQSRAAHKLPAKLHRKSWREGAKEDEAGKHDVWMKEWRVEVGDVRVARVGPTWHLAGTPECGAPSFH